MCQGVSSQVPLQRGQGLKARGEVSDGLRLCSSHLKLPSTPRRRLRHCPGVVSSRQPSWTTQAGLGAFLSPHVQSPSPHGSLDCPAVASLHFFQKTSGLWFRQLPSPRNVLPRACTSSAFGSELTSLSGCCWPPVLRESRKPSISRPAEQHSPHDRFLVTCLCPLERELRGAEASAAPAASLARRAGGQHRWACFNEGVRLAERKR